MWQPLYLNRGRGGGADRPHHQRGARRRAGSPRRCTCSSTGTWGPTGRDSSAIPETWEGIDTVEDAELWETQQVLKARMINFVRNRLAAQARRRDEPDSAIERAMEALDLNALTIGFARRFATYKRAGLVLQDVERLIEMVSSADRPIQFIFGGKAHPEDRMGKELIQNIARLTRQERFAPRIVFVEDYDMNVARQLVQGVDVWLNNPRRPQEASGTSGEKAALNGALNFSILDGWWAEAYDGTNGFAIGTGQTHANPSVQDERDHRALIETLTEQVVPLYYKRDASGLPRELDRPAEGRLPDAGLAVQRGPHGDGLRPATATCRPPAASRARCPDRDLYRSSGQWPVDGLAGDSNRRGPDPAMPATSDRRSNRP